MIEYFYSDHIKYTLACPVGASNESKLDKLTLRDSIGNFGKLKILGLANICILN